MTDIMRKVISDAIDTLTSQQIQARKQSDATYEDIIKRMRKALKLMDKYKGKKKFTDSELEKIQSITCFHGLGFCCGLSKPCYFRDAALHILGISKEQFKREKEKWTKSVSGKVISP